MSDLVELKYLNRRLEEARSVVKVLTEDKLVLEEKIKREKDTINKLEKDIKNIRDNVNGRLVVSEHALLRYFERVLNYDLEEIKKKIVPDTVETAIKTMGSGTFPTETHKLKVKNGIVVTILTDE